MAADRPGDRPSDATSTDASNPTTPTDTPPTTATWPLLDKAEKSPPEPDTPEEANPPIWARGPRHVLVTNREGFILDDALGPLHTGEIERAKEWGAQLVRRIVVHPEGWAIWDRVSSGNE